MFIMLVLFCLCQNVSKWDCQNYREKRAFENSKDIGSQQKSLVPTGYQMNMLYSPHWWPDEHFFSVPTGDQTTMTGDR